MEEYVYKLSQNNPILTLEVMTKLTRKLRTYYSEGNKNEFQKYYNFLREQCISGSHSKSATAMACLIELAEAEDVITLSTLHKDMMMLVNSSENLSGIINLIFHAIFRLDIVYDMMKHQHPLISILKKDQGTWPLILAKISEKFRSEAKVRVLQKLQPFAMYVLYDYDDKIDRVLQLEMLEIYRLHFDTISRQKIIVLNLPFLRRSILYCKVLLQEIPEMLPYLITAIQSLLESDQDATDAFCLLNQFLQSNPDRNYALELILLSECIAITPATNMMTLCDSLLIMLSAQHYSPLVQSAVKSALSCWKLHYSSTYSNQDELYEEINDILNIPKEFDVEQEKIEYNELLDAKQFLFAYALKTKFTPKELRIFQGACTSIKLNLFAIFLALLYNDGDPETTLDTIELCLDCCLLNSKNSFRLLPVLLHKLSTSLHPEVHMAILRALPVMGVLKENLQTVVMIFKAMANVSPQMHSVCLPLMHELVVVDKSCFPFFEEMLTLNAATTNQDLIVAKAYSVRRMCAMLSSHRLENFRKELATHGSQILAKCHTNALAVGFAFDGLVDLCHGMNAYNTYVSLAERFENDERERVVIGMCRIMGETANIPDLEDSKCERIIKSLFAYAQSSQSRTVSAAAYNAIAKFTPEQIALGFPVSFADDLSDSISGASWLCLLHNAPRIGLQEAGNMLIELICRDFKTHHRSLQTESHVEPLYMKLPRDNILAEVAKFAKKQSTRYMDVDREVYMECLRILAFKYKRPLPAMDWTFLKGLADDSGLIEYALTIAAHQSNVSNSARTFLETFIKSLIEKDDFTEEFQHVFNLLPYLCNTIQPVLMKPFFKTGLNLALNLLRTNNVNKLNALLDRIGEMLRNANVSESNKLAVVEVLQSIIDGYEMQTEEFRLLLPALGSAKEQYLNDSYWPIQNDCINVRILLRCLSVRSAIALNENDKPFALLDSVIDCRGLKSLSVSDQATISCFGCFVDILELVKPVFEKHWEHPGFASWLNELFVKIEVELADKHDFKAVSFHSMVLVIAIVVGSGYDIFATSLTDFIDVLPHSLLHLLHSKPFAPFVAHILESIYDYSTNPLHQHNEMSDAVTRKYKQTILLLRTHNAFNEKLNWMKYIEINL